MLVSEINSNPHVIDQDFTEFNMNANHFQLLDEKYRLFYGPAKNLLGPAPVFGPAVENHRCENDPIGLPELDKKIRLRLPVLSGIRLHPKTSESLRLRLRNPVWEPLWFLLSLSQLILLPAFLLTWIVPTIFPAVKQDTNKNQCK